MPPPIFGPNLFWFEFVVINFRRASAWAGVITPRSTKAWRLAFQTAWRCSVIFVCGVLIAYERWMEITVGLPDLYRTNESELWRQISAGYDILLRPSHQTLGQDYTELEKALLALLRRAKLT